MSSLPKVYFTPDDYLIFDANNEKRHEYYQGEIFAMAGATLRHNLIKEQTARELGNQLKGKHCLVVSSDMRLKITKKTHYTYPDIVLVCGKPEIVTEKGQESLLNPTVIVEVLSASTEQYDRTAKFQHYQTIEAFQEYLLVSQDQTRVDHYSRNEDHWILRTYFLPQSTIQLDSIGATLTLAQIYENIEFEESEPPSS